MCLFFCYVILYHINPSGLFGIIFMLGYNYFNPSGLYFHSIPKGCHYYKKTTKIPIKPRRGEI